MENMATICCNCGVAVVTSADGGTCHSCSHPVQPSRTVFNDPGRRDIAPDLVGSKTVSTDSELAKRIELLRRQGEVMFGQIAPQLNRLQPGRERTHKEFEQICIALALLIHHLLDIDGDEGHDDGGAGRGADT